MYLTKKQLRWLDKNGGRTQADVLEDEDQCYYVLMGNGRGGYKKVYLP